MKIVRVGLFSSHYKRSDNKNGRKTNIRISSFHTKIIATGCTIQWNILFSYFRVSIYSFIMLHNFLWNSKLNLIWWYYFSNSKFRNFLISPLRTEMMMCLDDEILLAFNSLNFIFSRRITIDEYVFVLY